MNTDVNCREFEDSNKQVYYTNEEPSKILPKMLQCHVCKYDCLAYIQNQLHCLDCLKYKDRASRKVAIQVKKIWELYPDSEKMVIEKTDSDDTKLFEVVLYKKSPKYKKTFHRILEEITDQI